MLLRINISLSSKGILLYERIWLWKGKNPGESISALVQILQQFNREMDGGTFKGAQFETPDSKAFRTTSHTHRRVGTTGTRRLHKVTRKVVWKMHSIAIKDITLVTFYTSSKEKQLVQEFSKAVVAEYCSKYASLVDEHRDAIIKTPDTMPDALTKSYPIFQEFVDKLKLKSWPAKT